MALAFSLLMNEAGQAKSFIVCLDIADLTQCDKACKEKGLKTPSITPNDPSCTPLKEGTYGCYCE